MATTTFTPSQLRGINSSFPYKNYGLWAPEITGGGGGGGFPNTYSLAFDGVDDFVSIPETSYSGAFSISLWINPEDFTLQFICGENGANQNYIWAQTSTLLWFTAGGTAISFTESGGNDLVAGQWQNLIITRDSSNNVNVYRNGVAFGSTTTNAGTFKLDAIGKAGAIASWIYHGKIDEVAIWNSDETANVSTISTSPVVDLTSLNPFAWYRMGDSATWKSPQWLIPENSNKDKFSNYSFEYDGVDDYVDLGSGTSLEFTNDFSVSVWIKETGSLNRGIFCCGNRSGTSGWMIYRTSANKVSFSVYTANNRIATSTTSINTGDWFNVIGTFEKNGTANQQVKIYINGTFEGQNGWISPQTPTYLGTIYKQIAFPYAGSNEFLGNIDEVSAFNYLLSTDEINTISTTPSDLASLSPVGYWRSEQSNFSDNWLIDNSALSNYSTRSFNFDGVDDYVNLGNNTDFNTNDTISVSAWFKTSDDTTPTQQIFSKTFYRLQIQDYFGGSRIVWTVYHTAGSLKQIVASGTEYADGQWHHALCVYESNKIGGMALYVDGVLIGSADSSTQIHTSTNPLLIGVKNTSLQQPLNGSVDELAFWTNNQSANVASIYNSGIPADLTSLSPVSWWRMGEDATFNTNWSLPDNGSASNTGTSANMTISDLEGDAPNYTGGGLSNNMTIEDRVGDASNSSNNALSYNMDEVDRETDVPS